MGKTIVPIKQRKVQIYRDEDVYFVDEALANIQEMDFDVTAIANNPNLRKLKPCSNKELL
ncbi:hypothetical protein [Pseudanabaena sp. BC1403]|uniref:hypothetical protein n=1 Tax=Pseudanabaena sp. BC1403 TaxID=2043171 RepID=UPI0011AFB5A7|nr:hypothetical protein [Pseudanabaena sp. BC1403]